jgi:hypothetical protein
MVVDLRELMQKIKQQKNMNANLALEFDCTIETENPTPLIKVINYIINYIAPLSDKAIEIQLNAQMSGILLSFSVFSEQTTFPPLSEQIADALSEYNATLQVKKEEGKYFQILIVFAE